MQTLFKNNFMSVNWSTPGVFAITNEKNNRCLYGKNKLIGNKVYKHINCLIVGKHPNESLQKDFNYFGLDAFKYAIVEETNSAKIRHNIYCNQLMLYKKLTYNNILPFINEYYYNLIEDIYKLLKKDRNYKDIALELNVKYKFGYSAGWYCKVIKKDKDRRKKILDDPRIKSFKLKVLAIIYYSYKIIDNSEIEREIRKQPPYNLTKEDVQNELDDLQKQGYINIMDTCCVINKSKIDEIEEDFENCIEDLDLYA